MRARRAKERPERPLDDRLLEELDGALEGTSTFCGSYEIRNTDRAVGGRLSGRIAGVHGDRGLPPGSIGIGS